jgi:superfamily II DNA or RNA helicase
MSDLFSGLPDAGGKRPGGIFANANTVFNTVIFLLRPQTALPGLGVALHPAKTAEEGLERLGKALVRNQQHPTDADLYGHYGGGLSPLLLAHTAAGFGQWAQKRSMAIAGPMGPLPWEQLAESNQQLLLRHYHNLWKSFWPHLQRSQQFYIAPPADRAMPPLEEMVPLRFSPSPLKASVKVSAKGKGFDVSATVSAKGEVLPIDPNNIYMHLLYLHDGTVYLPESPFLFQLLGHLFPLGRLHISASLAELFLNELLPQLQEHLPVELDGTVQGEAEQLPPQPLLALSEMEPDLLVLKPVFRYGDTEVEYEEQATRIELREGGKLRLIERDKTMEAAFKQQVQQLHPLFANQGQRHFFYLPIKEAMKNHWFAGLAETLQQQGITLYGHTNLKKLRYSPHAPQLSVTAGSGTDWFDLKVLLRYGSQTVGLAQLRQAVLNKQDYVQLDDGTWGMLPEEWLQRFTAFFKLGKTSGDTVQLGKRHFTALQDWSSLDTSAIEAELEQKRQRLLELDRQEPFALPNGLQAQLRPYQLAGYQWLRQLHHIGWGGCLADDMGLGKTLQTLAFLLSVAEQQPNAQLLIVCPTSLLYNWAAELQKFAPGLPYHLYHGSARSLPQPLPTLLITSYGTLRSDIEQLKEMAFDVAVLDESQVIKNPAAQLTRAVGQLRATSRFVLSGTPIQNNTLDLYAQLHFANPGLLGSLDTFKELFVNPIDKKGDAAAVGQLRQLVRPFLLRRTKEQVAPDLPDKTETVLYCEMDEYQREVYDAIKEEYRERIVSGAMQDGMPAVLMLLLEGLGRLRMVCGCPSLLKAVDGKRFRQSSVKADELMREIEENSGNHKILVFSQFLGMLQMVQERLGKAGIGSLYLDGSTPPAERAQLVQRFQEDPAQQVFLISLKAGGVGLTLTAADYVYLLDPWWNPAAEDQAIDRTHRIGQTQKVFAYKMICRNTVEEKIMQLQQKKKHLAKELISEEASFVKKLTMEEVAFLLE